MKQAPTELVTLTVRVNADTADKLRALAEGNYRPVAAELRRMIEAHVAADQPEAA